MQDNEQMREAFEAWAINNIESIDDGSLTRRIWGENRYAQKPVENAWQAWQAALASRGGVDCEGDNNSKYSFCLEATRANTEEWVYVRMPKNASIGMLRALGCKSPLGKMTESQQNKDYNTMISLAARPPVSAVDVSGFISRLNYILTDWGYDDNNPKEQTAMEQDIAELVRETLEQQRQHLAAPVQGVVFVEPDTIERILAGIEDDSIHSERDAEDYVTVEYAKGCVRGALRVAATKLKNMGFQGVDDFFRGLE